MKKFSRINVGVVGVGFIGAAHVEALRRIGVNVVGVVGSTPERVRAKADVADLPTVYDSVEHLATDPDIDVIHIATPNAVHYDQVLTCIAAGKHIVCEKPLAVTSEQSAELVSRAKAAGVVHAVCFNLRFYGHVLQSRAMVAAGELGDVTYVTGRYFQDWLLLDTDWNWRLVPQVAGELRAVADIGSHWLDLARFITGQDIVEVMSDLYTFVPVRRHPDGPVETFAAMSQDENLVEELMTSDDAASIMLRFESGARGLVAVSQVSAGRKNDVRFEINGSSSSVAWRSEDPELLFVGHRGRPNELLNRDPSLVHASVAPHIGYPGGHVEGYPDTFRALFAAVYTDVASGEPAPAPNYPTFADGHDSLLVAEAVARSAADQRWIPVDR
ncbi:MAG: Gfo/Idh/MocA family oxidoreductase [Actinomycetota bacterium]|nr:Gfo/Idh/MocA family oxidoreductase [Actinomycetota bacterium]MDK1025887.1 Gfo/Idh/MocA family oxidoreductase [Actinomycetota bacterium]MDK1038644.1 Gfo/Idh/MocA family oxidoreductase [Actinomycetota bacterium]MDK1096669.1 Gfo/Idh/MocA family oxidoreductase [Actinomycetota bacterium]MDK1102812.1 Gfo/Idh/MocA family oxidoreductase [Actinomycetota bacterium]